MKDLEKGRHVLGDDRRVLAKEMSNRYRAGESIRAIATAYGRSYGFVYRLLAQDSTTPLRQRGGDTTRKRGAR